MRKTTWLMVFGAMLACTMMTAGEDNPNGGRRQRGQGGAGGGFDPAARMERLKTSLGVNDDEWKALQPKVEAVETARRSTMAGMFGGGRGPGGGGGGNTDNQTPIQTKRETLRTTLANKEADAKTVQEALKSYRDERDKAREALKKAQTELKELLTAKQEAEMVLSGMLE